MKNKKSDPSALQSERNCLEKECKTTKSRDYNKKAIELLGKEFGVRFTELINSVQVGNKEGIPIDIKELIDEIKKDYKPEVIRKVKERIKYILPEESFNDINLYLDFE